MELGSLGARVLLLSCLCIAALVTALLVAGGLRSAARPVLSPVTVKVVGLEPVNVTLAQEEIDRVLELAQSSREFRELLEEGFRVVDAHPVFKCKVHLEDGVLKIESVERIGVTLILERDGERAYALVYSDGRVMVSKGSLAISLP